MQNEVPKHLEEKYAMSGFPEMFLVLKDCRYTHTHAQRERARESERESSRNYSITGGPGCHPQAQARYDVLVWYTGKQCIDIFDIMLVRNHRLR